MAIDWSVVHPHHVERACAHFDRGQERQTHPARNAFLIFEGKQYPAKFIRGLAYQLATGHRLDPSTDYSGGLETVRFFERLGFETSYFGSQEAAVPDRALGPRQPRARPSVAMRQSPAPGLGARTRASADPQKDALLGLLRRRFADVQTEARLPWLRVPALAEMNPVLRDIHRALQAWRGHETFTKPGFALACDFFVPCERLVIEYDERQHFTAARALALSLYPADTPLGFDQGAWLAECRRVDAHDNDPPSRDETRAFYDSVRDLLAAEHGVRLVRLRAGDCDWTALQAQQELDSLLSPSAPSDAKRSRKDEELSRIALVSHDYRVTDHSGHTDFAEHFTRINELCDGNGCDTILYALFGWAPDRQEWPSADLLRGLAHVRRLVIEVAEHGHSDGQPAPVEIWEHGRDRPRVVYQCFAGSKDRDLPERKLAFVRQLPDRRLADGLLMLCGESNIVSLSHATSQFVDLFGFVAALDRLGARVILNPIHDYMRRYEMRAKREYYSRGGRVVASVWNRGKGPGEAWLPWTLFRNGKDKTSSVREVPSPLPDRPDIRIGIASVGS